MEIIQLTKENAAKYSYGCMMKGNIYVRHPQPYREAVIPDFQSHIGKDVFGFVAVENDLPVGHLLMGYMNALGMQIRIQPDVPVILCTYVNRRYSKKGLGRSLIEAAKAQFSTAPGLLILSTKTNMYMPFKKFRRYGFKMIHVHDMWQIGYLAIQKDEVQVEFFDPVLEWDYVKPFTLIQGGFCPFILHIYQNQKKVAETFKQFAPVETMTLEEARKKDPNVLPGFYVFGSLAPAKPMFRWQFKRYIRKAIRKEEKKTFGAAAPTNYGKRKN